MCFALFPAHQEEHVLVLVPSPWECDQEGEEVPNYLDQNIAMPKKQTFRRNENSGLLGKRMRLARRELQQPYFQRHAPVR